MTLHNQWLAGKATDEQILKQTDTLKGTKKDRALLVICGHYAVQHFDYMNLVKRASFDTMALNFGFLLPGSPEFTYMFHGSMGYIKALHTCSSFHYFCQQFKGTHVFVTTTAHCKGGLYPIAPKKDVIHCIRKNNISRFQIITHAQANKGMGWIPPNLGAFSPSKVPYGCGGTLNAMAVPFILQLGYLKVFFLGLGDTNITHFYDVEYIQPHLRKPHVLPYRALTLKRYAHWNALAKKNNTQLVVFPRSHTEPAIQKIFDTIETIK